VIHVRGSTGAALLGGVDVPCALLGTNLRWVSFVPLDGADVDAGALAVAASAHVARVWFTDDEGVFVVVTGPDGFGGELNAPRGDEGPASLEDQRFVDELVRRKVLSRAAAGKLIERLSAAPSVRDRWIDDHGFEKLFGFPFVYPIPEGASLEVVLDFAPSAGIVEPGRVPALGQSAAQRRRRASSPPVSPPQPELPPEAGSVLDLHVHYWTFVWSLNNQWLFNLYKKHLPAGERREVDRLGYAVLMGRADEIRELVTTILTRAWSAQDWDAVIRSPQVDDVGTEEEEAHRWRQMTGRGER